MSASWSVGELTVNRQLSEGDMHKLSVSKTNPRKVSLLVGVKTDLSECINSKTKTLEDINNIILYVVFTCNKGFSTASMYHLCSLPICGISIKQFCEHSCCTAQTIGLAGGLNKFTLQCKL